MANSIKCPNCGHIFDAEEEIRSNVEEKIREEYLKKYQTTTKEKIEEAKKITEKEYSDEIKKLKEENQEKEKAINEISEKEKNLEKLQKALKEEQKLMEEKAEEIAKKKAAQYREEILEKAKKEFDEEYNLKMKQMQEEIESKKQKTNELQKEMLEMMKKNRESEEKLSDMKLEKEKALDEERKKAYAIAAKKKEEEFELEKMRYDKEKNMLKKQINELKSSSDNISQQLQGQSFEDKILDMLKMDFGTDSFTPKVTGQRGADIIQKVIDRSGKTCGSIIWELKSAQHWNNNWPTKLKEDQAREKADFAVILTLAMPNNIENIGVINDIWVVNFASFIGLTHLLRRAIINVDKIKRANKGKNDKVDIMFNYFTSSDFRQKIELIIETFNEMKSQLDSEKKALNKQWSKREKLIEKVLTSTSNLYGDLEGIIGNDMQKIDMLELPGEDAQYEIE